MSFQDELNRVTKTPEDVLSKREKESYAKGVDSAFHNHGIIQTVNIRNQQCNGIRPAFPERFCHDAGSVI